MAPWYQSQRWQINFELLKAEYRLLLRTFVYIRVSCLFTMLHYMSYEINLLVVNNQMTLILADFQWLCQSMSNQYSNSNNERKYWFYLSNKLQRDDTICKLDFKISVVNFCIVTCRTMFKVECSIVQSQKFGVWVRLPKDEDVQLCLMLKKTMFESVQ